MSDRPSTSGGSPPESATDPHPASPAAPVPVFETTVSDGVCRLVRPGTRFLSTGFDGGRRVADAAYNVTVPTGFDARDLRAYVADRLGRAGFDGAVGPDAAPALLTGVDQSHARIARAGSVAVLATAGISNPAALPIDGRRDAAGAGCADEAAADRRHDADSRHANDRRHDVDPRHAPDRHHAGTVNLVAGTTRSLSDGALANLLTVVAEAKAATLLALTGFPGTTSDAVIVADDPDGEPATFSGSATPVGRATRVCVRDAVTASLRSRYGEVATDSDMSGNSDGSNDGIPTDVADADHGVVTDGRATVTRVETDADPGGDL